MTAKFRFWNVGISLVAIFYVTPGAADAAEMVDNGGFEAGTLDGTPLGWTFGFTGNAADPFVRNNSSFDPFEGNLHLQFRGNSAAATGGAFVEQVLTTNAGASYDLRFALGQANPGNTSVQVTVTSAGGPLGDLFNETFTGLLVNDYSFLERTFAATNSASTLRFLETSSNTSLTDPFLDAVSVSAVPEPACMVIWSLLGIGCLGIYLTLRR